MGKWKSTITEDERNMALDLLDRGSGYAGGGDFAIWREGVIVLLDSLRVKETEQPTRTFLFFGDKNDKEGQRIIANLQFLADTIDDLRREVRQMQEKT